MKRFFIVYFATLLCGCSAVCTREPVGEKPTNIQGQQDKWEGTWINVNADHQAITVKVVDGSNGVLTLGCVEENAGSLRYGSADVYLRDHGGWTFANIKTADQTEKDPYFWARIKKEDRVAILWPPSVARFRNLVTQGRLPGSTNQSGIVLGNLASNHLDLITSETNGILFDWDEPIVLIKMSK